MVELCLGLYLQILYRAKNEDKKNTKTFFVGEILSVLSNDFDPSSTAMSKLFTGINNPKYVLITIATCITRDYYLEIIDQFRQVVMPMLNPNKISDAVRLIEIAIAEDSEIKQDTEVDLISGLKKKDMKGAVDDPAIFLAGIFLYVMKCTKNPGVSGVIGPMLERLVNISPDYVFEEGKNTGAHKTKEEYDSTGYRTRELVVFDEQIEQKATNFCIKYDYRKDWIPLCQVAQITNPLKKHSNRMFTDYCKSTRSVRRKILEINGISEMELSDDDWWYEYMGKFSKDYSKYELGDERYLYAFTQYFPNLLRYENESIQDIIQQSFVPKIKVPMVIPNLFRLDVAGLIDEYIIYRKYDKYKNLLVPPMDYMWRVLNFDHCSEFVLASFLALFIIGTCRKIPTPDNMVFRFSGPDISELESAEELFYLALLTLYENYEMVHNNETKE